MIQDKWNFLSPTNFDLKGVEATLQRFANYPASTIKDEILSRLVYDIGIQGRAFRTLTQASSSQCANLTRSTADIIVNFEKIKTSEFISYSTKSELTISEILKECNLIRKGYKDISHNLTRISNDFQTYKSNLQKEQYTLEQEVSNIKYRSKSEKIGAIKMGVTIGFGIGSFSNATLYAIAPQLDGGLTLIATIITGGVLGWYYGGKLSSNLNQEAILKENEIGKLRKSTDYIEHVMKDVKFFDDKVGLFEIFWARQIDHISVTQQFINNAKKGNVEINNFNVQSLLASWTHAKTALASYQANVKAIIT
ncbi:20210_t:CDS:1 [Dentiscutata erythropus]|uniref:20210_t:CDS:1 n=1 Tax=Dentiscutata erythropus TaxID=1348616 RepID=A0A9N8YVM9_9GLOM|nr:20210_t:CDS:1 [Dentiscutata erythropus]